MSLRNKVFRDGERSAPFTVILPQVRSVSRSEDALDERDGLAGDQGASTVREV